MNPHKRECTEAANAYRHRNAYRNRNVAHRDRIVSERGSVVEQPRCVTRGGDDDDGAIPNTGISRRTSYDHTDSDISRATMLHPLGKTMSEFLHQSVHTLDHAIRISSFDQISRDVC